MSLAGWSVKCGQEEEPRGGRKMGKKTRVAAVGQRKTVDQRDFDDTELIGLRV